VSPGGRWVEPRSRDRQGADGVVVARGQPLPDGRGSAVVLMVAALLLGLALPAAAHDRSTSYSTWDIREREARVTVRLALLDASRFPWFSQPGAEETLPRYLADRLALAAGDAHCAPIAPPRRLEAPPERLVYEWRVRCPADGELSLRSEILLDVAPSHLHFARVRRDGVSLLERVLSDGDRSWALESEAAEPEAEAGAASVRDYVALGIEHILTGYDHLAFVLALILIEASLWEVAKVVTGFTLGHSITLALAILGLVSPDTAAVEALIGLSIALVAGENLWLLGGRPWRVPWALAAVLLLLAGAALLGRGTVPGLTLGGLALFTLCYFALLERVAQPVRLRWAVAFLFGLIHGFGFASVLAEAHLSADRLLRALVGFNTGVEIGQIGVVLLLWPVLGLVARAAAGRLVVEVASAAVLALGTFWFVTRAYG